MRSLQATLVGLITMSLFIACAGNSQEDLELLTARVDELEERLDGLASLPPASRSLQDAEPAPAAERIDDGQIVRPATNELLEGGLLVAVERSLAEAAFLGVADPDFGGTTVVGDDRQITITLDRAGLEDQNLVVAFLRSLGFSDEVLTSVQSVGDSGDAISQDATTELAWRARSEELVLELRLR